ncbi:YncE family protein [Aurantibacillus circumpalustris]|uniref:YncE family protein n=1 Tax=Aurantibacillus circumpalustris TaxID=3036359 RepID=UPI00295BA925|nr:YncE family protein [Aurantibacillus circumpalustris]
MKKTFVYILVSSLLVFFSCTKDIGKKDYTNFGNYPREIGNIMASSCAVTGCHNSESYLAASDFNLESWEKMFLGSSNGSPVVPYSSQFSSLCYFINTYPDLGIQNTPVMPLNGIALSYKDVKTIKDWINNGAPDMNGNIKWADNPKRKKFYAVNQGCDVVTVFDAETQLPMRFIEVGNKPGIESPHQVRVSEDGNYWYVLFVNNNIMQKYRCSDDSYVGDIPLTPLAAGSGPENNLDWNTFIISKDGKRAYCASYNPSGRVSAVDLEKMKLIAYSGVLSSPHGIALNAEEDKVYVGAQENNYITVLDTTFTDANKIFLDNSSSSNSSIKPHDLLLSEDKKSLFITCQESNEVRILNLTTGQITIIPTGKMPQEIVYSKSFQQYFVTCTEDNVSFPNFTGVITRIDAEGYATKNIQCGFQPHGIAVDEIKKILYVLSRNVSTSGPLPHHTSQCGGRNGFVSFVDLTTFSVLKKRYELSADPYFIFARP